MASLNDDLFEDNFSVAKDAATASGQNKAKNAKSTAKTTRKSAKSQSKSQAVTDDLPQLLAILPDYIQQKLDNHPRKEQLIEVILDLGRPPEARFSDSVEYLSETPVSKTDLQHCVERVGHFGGDNRAGLEKTLHRISAMRNRKGDVIGLTCRVGRAIFGTIGLIRDLVETGNSILMLGRPGVGKTTALREIARVLADDLMKRVVIIDTSNEIAGDGDIPHPAIGRARRMQVARPEEQHQVMIEAVENHMPEVIVIDEIGTELEALAARTIAERGVQLVGTAHGNRLENLIKNPTLSDLVGGIQSVTLGDDEARRRGSQKSVLERKAPPTFDIAVEMLERQRWVVHEEVSNTVDFILRGRVPGQQVRSLGPDNQVVITDEMPADSSLATPALRSDKKGKLRAGSLRSQASPGGWRTSGKMRPPITPLGSDSFGKRANLSSVPSSRTVRGNTPVVDSLSDDQLRFQSLLDDSMRQLPIPSDRLAQVVGDDYIESEDENITRIYAYGISRQHLYHVVRSVDLPVKFSKELTLD